MCICMDMQASCEADCLLRFAGKDATKEFDAAKHSDAAREMAKKYLVGEYREVSVHGVFRLRICFFF